MNRKTEAETFETGKILKRTLMISKLVTWKASPSLTWIYLLSLQNNLLCILNISAPISYHGYSYNHLKITTIRQTFFFRAPWNKDPNSNSKIAGWYYISILSIPLFIVISQYFSTNRTIFTTDNILKDKVRFFNTTIIQPLTVPKSNVKLKWILKLCYMI